MLAMGKETVGVPVAGSGVQVTEVWSSEMVMMPSFFLKMALPLGIAMLKYCYCCVRECQDTILLIEMRMMGVIPLRKKVYVMSLSLLSTKISL